MVGGDEGTPSFPVMVGRCLTGRHVGLQVVDGAVVVTGLSARRILIYGVTGSGKTFLAQQVAQRTGLPGHSVDDLTWLPGWTPVPDAEQRARISLICAQDEWVLDSAYSDWRDIVLARTDLIVALDYPRWVSLTRLVRRTVGRIRDRRPVCNGNVETLRQAFGRDSIIRWHSRSFRGKRERMRRWAKERGPDKVVLLRTPKQTRSWLGTL